MTKTRKEIWIVEGVVADTDAHPTAKLGDPEWQFSDGPPGQRGASADYLSLEEGLRDHSGAVFHFCPAPAAEPRSFVQLPVAGAYHAGWVLLWLAEHEMALRTIFGVGNINARKHIDWLQQAGNALMAVSDDTDMIVTRDEDEGNG